MLPILRDPSATQTLFQFILETPNGRRSVSRLARTCKALKEPAVNVLWKELDSIVPLLSLMPTHLFKRAKRPGLGFAKMPEEKDWDRLLAYGQRVRKIGYHEAAGNVSPGVFSVIEDYRPQDFILPNLTALNWRAETPEGLERILLFLTSGIQDLVVETGTKVPQAELEEFFSDVAQLPLSTLYITSAAKLPEYLPKILQAQASLQKLGLNAPGSLAPSIGRWLSSMSTLSSLAFDVTGRSDAAISAFFDQNPLSGVASPASEAYAQEELDFSSETRPGTGSGVMIDMAAFGGRYKGLRQLHLTGEVTAITTFLSRIITPIQELELVVEDPEDESDWNILCSMICRRFRHNLQCLKITASGSSRFADLVRSTSRGESTGRHLSLDGFSSMPRLRRLDIDLPESIILHDVDISRLAAACPNLETLRLAPMSRWPIPSGGPQLSLAGLSPLTTHCQRLHTLALPINAIGATDDDVYVLESSSRSLQNIHVGHSWITDPLEVAILLSHLAPHLETLKWFHEKNRPGYVEANSKGWQKVSEVLPSLQRLRLRERSQIKVVESPPPQVEEVIIGQEIEEVVEEKIVKPTTVEIGIQAAPDVMDKAIDVQPPPTISKAVEPLPPSIVVHPPVDMSPEPENVAPATNVEDEKSEGVMEIYSEKGQPIGSESPTNYSTWGMLTGTVGHVSNSVRSFVPPILLRMVDMWFMVTLNSVKVYSDEMIAAMRSPLLFGSDIPSSD